MSEKVLSKQEWIIKVLKEKEWSNGFDIARQGMYTLEEAQAALIESGKVIPVPDVSEWPEFSGGILVVHTNAVKFEPIEGNDYFIKFIPRPAPAWEPKVGDAVFALDYNKRIWVAKVSDTPNVGWCSLLCQDGEILKSPVKDIKPFDPAKIGLKWEEI